MFNSRNLGALIVDDKPHVKEWDEPQFGIQNLGIEESYGFGVLNEGLSDRCCQGVFQPLLKRGGRRRRWPFSSWSLISTSGEALPNLLWT
ncbi:MAG TPA: hypothetical protein VFC39_16100 [Acidobacteriaceae bacterium]|nr:hypothetical protein [Acidobacteriaceae bacterium]